MLEIYNSADVDFLGGSVVRASFKQASGGGIAHDFEIENCIIPILKPLEKSIINTKMIVTHLFGPCFIEFHFKAIDNQHIEIFTPRFDGQLEKQSAPNRLLNSCFVYSQEVISSRQASRINFGLALIATISSCVALYISLGDRSDSSGKFLQVKNLLTDQISESQKISTQLEKANGIIAELKTSLSLVEKNTKVIKK